ncbi:MAG: sulfurtransferase [Polyangiales bacterium]
MIRFPIADVTEFGPAEDGPVVWVDARQGPSGAEAYAASHVVGAVHVDLERDLSGDTAHPERGGRHPLPSVEVWCARLGAMGIGPESTVLVYDDKGGANAAARFWWMLRAVGHARVAIVDGGWAAIEAARIACTGERTNPVVQGAYPANAWLRPVVDADAVARATEDASCFVLDVREGDRFRGEREPVDPVAGHIPGAHNLYFGENLGADGRFKSADALRVQYESLFGGVPMDRVTLHCGSGVTACHTLAALERAGFDGASLYVGSWSEWCRSDRPRVTK